MVLIVAVLVVASLYGTATLPEAVRADAPPEVFSSGRAMKHVATIARIPHPSGSAEEDQVREYILKTLRGFGLDAQLQTTPVVKNIVARLKGSEGKRAILLAAHYDTVWSSPGAGDDSSGVSVILESARVLSNGPRLKNDVIFLLTDGEENGLLGAKAFVYEHPWAREVGMLMNFDARGNSGPPVMFETSRNNGWLIREFGRAAPRPVTNSMMTEIYKAMPNDTDFTIFKDEGYQGYNVALIKGFKSYHSALDRVEGLNERSLQQEGELAVAVSRRFGNLNLDQATGGSCVFFSVFGATVLHYNVGWVGPLTGCVSVLFVLVTFVGLKKKYLSLPGIGIGLCALLLGIVCAAASVAVFSTLVGRFRGGNGDELYLAVCALLSVAAAALVYRWFRKNVSGGDLTMGALFYWLVLMVVSAVYFPLGSYLFTWPLLAALVHEGLLGLSNGKMGTIKQFAALTASALVGIALVVPMIYLVFSALPAEKGGAVSGPIVLLFGLIIPHAGTIVKANHVNIAHHAASQGLGMK